MGRIAGHAIRSLITRLGEFETCPDCANPGTQADGACDVHTTVGRTADEIKQMAREKQSRSVLQSERNRQLGEHVAALKGDTRPAEWNLLHSRTVEPLKVDSSPGGIVVNVGVILPGLPGAEVIDVKQLPRSEDPE